MTNLTNSGSSAETSAKDVNVENLSKATSPAETSAKSSNAKNSQKPTSPLNSCMETFAQEFCEQVFAAKHVCMTETEIERTLTRMAHQIVEANDGAENLAIVGIITRGDILARKLATKINAIESADVPHGNLDISFYRDDISTHVNPCVHSTSIPFAIDNMTVVLVDDVLFTGRTIRAALDALTDIGRPAAVQLAVLVDRGHRELPIRADYVGKNVPSSEFESVRLLLEEVDGRTAVEIYEVEEGGRPGSLPLK